MGIRSSVGELGPLGFASYAAARLADAVPGLSWHRYRLIAVPRGGMPAMPRGFESRVMSGEEVAANAGVLDLPQAAIRHRASQSMACVGVWRRAHLVGVNWVTDQAFDEDEVALRFAPPEGCAWDTGLFVRPEDRGGRGFAALWAGTALWMAERALDWSMSRITDHNLASWRSHCRMGGKPMGSVAVVGVGGRQWSPSLGATSSASPAIVRLARPA